jgi:hypothetical protein
MLLLLALRRISSLDSSVNYSSGESEHSADGYDCDCDDGDFGPTRMIIHQFLPTEESVDG